MKDDQVVNQSSFSVWLHRLIKSIRILQEFGFDELCRNISHFLRFYFVHNPKYFRKMNYVKHRFNGHLAVADPYKIVNVHPRDVTQFAPEFGKYESVGRIASGDWDKQTIPVENMIKYRSIRERFEEDMTWANTGIIEYHCEKIAESDKQAFDGCSDESEVIQRYVNIDKVYDNIKNFGYDARQHGEMDYIAVHVGREGQLLFAGSGTHRLSICKILDINEIPVWIRARHQKWQYLRDKIVSDDNFRKNVSDLRDHPDLQDLYD